MPETGLGPKAICDRCGLTVRHYDCATEWTGSFVCPDCMDPRPPWLDAPYIDPMEGAPLPNARFDVDPVFVDRDNPITPEDIT